jgi:hypothetical protein
MTEEDDRAGRALELRRAGVPLARIAEQLSYPSAQQARDATDALIAPPGSPAQVRAEELDRVERLRQAIWARAMKGDPIAVDKVLKLTEIRLRLAGLSEPDRRLRKAFEASLAGVTVTQADTALVEAGRRLCDQMDQAEASGDPASSQKSLFLMPHLINVLRDLGATPAVRDHVTGAIRPPEQRKNELAEFKRKRRLAAQGH